MVMRAFTQADRFLSELESRQLKPAYVLVGDEAFFASVAATPSLSTWSRPIPATSDCSSSISPRCR